MDNALILIVEDEAPQAEMLRYNLESAGFGVLHADNGEDALLMIEEESPDLVVLDWMLPEVTGIEICRRLRERPATRALPIIMLTARGEETDRVRGLETGADDYLVKPFSPSELVARVRALLRRTSPALGGDVLEVGDIRMDIERHKVTRGGADIHLGPTEYNLLKTLMEKPTRVFSRETLQDRVWGRDGYVEDRTVDVSIRRLRKALNVEGAENVIRTVRGEGYSIETRD